MIAVIHVIASLLPTALRSRVSLQMEILALRHQLAVYQRRRPGAQLRNSDRLFWAWLSRIWKDWRDSLVIVQPRTVIAWQRRRFRVHWRRLSRPGRPAISSEIRVLIRRMSSANPLWGAPRIVGEFEKIGIEVAKSTVEKYMVRKRGPSSPTWKVFLRNHVRDLVSVDFFVVPTARFRILLVLLVLATERRRVLHFNVTENPTAEWTARQIIQAFPWESSPRFLLRDRDSAYGESFRKTVDCLGIEEVLTAHRSPWQNPYVERLIGTIRRECLDHILVFNEEHLRRILRRYFRYYHRWRTHRSLEMDAPEHRPIQEVGEIIQVPEVGGLHHHYERRTA